MQKKEQQPIRKRQREEDIPNTDSDVQKTTSSRYPKRGARKCYKEQEVPDEDHFLCK